MFNDLVVLVFVQLDLLQDGQQVAQGLFAGVGVFQVFPGIQLLQIALLELDRIGPGVDGYIDQLQSQIQEAVMVDANLGDDIGWLTIANQPVANFNHRHSV